MDSKIYNSIMEEKDPTIFTVRQEKEAPEQAACWQCDSIKEFEGVIK